ncbi:ArsR/SmtB family transcription factor [Oerskovia flava]|uniref:ArsR/SmtB family transcription factor n=1 Tax=Oerskovia flava TaxID=2986422 RepID=UPI00223F727D|nr:helix-turn-helix domain-containing protein [Oerskovia sp. JB1-3-2]
MSTDDPTDQSPAPGTSPDPASIPHRFDPVGPEALKALAHPLRIALLDAIATHGASTASGLAQRLGESSGATSYHLRQLEKHGFVQDVPGKGTGRERWWDRPAGGFTVALPTDPDDVATMTATQTINREFELSRQRKITDFMLAAPDMDPAWIDGAVLTTMHLSLTREQLAAVSAQLHDAAEAILAPYRDQHELPGARPVQLHLNIFPLVDGKENPS